VRAADELIERIVNSSQIPSARRPDIQRELRAHIEDFVTAAIDAGRDQNEIERLVLANFGDPGHIGEGFAWVYRHERRALRALAFALSTTVLATSLLAAILTVQSGLALGFGTPILKVLASRHTLIEALDILASVAFYLGLTSLESLFKNRPLPKAVCLLALLDTLLIASCTAAGLHPAFLVFGLVNGTFFRTIQQLVASKAGRVAIVVVCFPLAGLIMAYLRMPITELALVTTYASWLAMGVGYQLMTHFAVRVDIALLHALQRNP
jgi:hypothetical protein